MKLIILSTLLLLGSCSSYQTSSIANNKVMVAKNNHILWFTFGELYTCDVDKNGMVTSCKENDVSEPKKAKSKPVAGSLHAPPRF